MFPEKCAKARFVRNRSLCEIFLEYVVRTKISTNGYCSRRERFLPRAHKDEVFCAYGEVCQNTLRQESNSGRGRETCWFPVEESSVAKRNVENRGCLKSDVRASEIVKRPTGAQRLEKQKLLFVF